MSARRVFRACALAACALAACALAACALAACAPTAPMPATTAVAGSPRTEGPGGVGLRTFEAVDPVSHAALPTAVFYPTAHAGHATIGPYELAAASDAPIAPGRWPLIAISHGHGGSMFGHHDLAEALARSGFVVVAVEHVGDSYRDSHDFRSDRIALGRAYQISAALDAVLADRALAPHVDATRIGVAGFSAGGWTSLLLIGAHPDFSRIGAYCTRHPDDPDLCGGPVKLELESPRSTADPRVRAAFVMAPFAVPFGADAFRDVRAPVYLAWGTADHVLPPDENAEQVARALPTIVTKQPITGADHYVFTPPCGAELAREVPVICTDPAGIDRAAIHAQLDDAAVAFFRRELR